MLASCNSINVKLCDALKVVKLGFVTEITEANISQCKEVPTIGVVRHIEGVKGYLPVSYTEYIAISYLSVFQYDYSYRYGIAETTVLWFIDDSTIESGISVSYVMEKVRISEIILRRENALRFNFKQGVSIEIGLGANIGGSGSGNS